MVQKFFKFIPYLISCFLILIVTLLLGIGTYRFWLILLSRRMHRRQLLAKHLSKFFAVPIYLIGFYLILQVGGLSGLAATLVGGTGVMGIVLGLAGKNILEDLLSSFMLSLRNPFRVGDEVIIGNEKGVVHLIDSRCTMLLNSDGYFTQIPNSTVLAAIIKNISAHSLNRILFTIKMDKCHEVGAFMDSFQKTMEMNADTIVKDPKPAVFVTHVGRKTTSLQCSFWVDSNLYNLDKVKSNVLRSIHHFLDEEYLKQEKSEKSEPSPQQTQKKLKAEKTEIEASVKENVTAPSEKEILSERTKNIRLPGPA